MKGSTVSAVAPVVSALVDAAVMSSRTFTALSLLVLIVEKLPSILAPA
jgi:hypothetical protein